MSGPVNRCSRRRVRRWALVCGTMLCAGCMAGPGRPAATFSEIDRDAPLGAQRRVETYRPQGPIPSLGEPLDRARIAPADEPPRRGSIERGVPPLDLAPALKPLPKFPRIEPDEPALGQELDLQVFSPERKQLGGHATYRIVVFNPSDAAADGVTVRCRFDSPLTFPGSDVHEVVRKLDRLAAGETKELPLSLVCHETGSFCSRFTVTRRDNERDLEVASQQACVEFVTRQLDLDLIGPTRRTEGSRAEFNALLSNRSKQTLNNVQATLSFDRAFAPREASRGYERKAAALVWNLGNIGPMESVNLQVDLECLGTARRACVTLDVQAADFASEHEEACLEIVPVPGTLDLRVSDRDDPLEVGKIGIYEVTVHNIGLQPARKLALSVTLPDQVRVVGAAVKQGQAPVALQFEQQAGRLVFDIAESLPADATLIYAIEVEARRAGIGEFTARLTSSLSGTPVVASEPTSIQEP